MLRLDVNSTHASLVNCFYVLRSAIASQDMSNAGSPSAGGRLGRQSDLALAAKVVRVIDTRLPPVPRAFYNFVYSDESDTYADYGMLCGFLRSQLAHDLDGEDDGEFVYRVVSLTMLAPWEAKHRVFNAGGSIGGNRGMLHSSDRLADMLGVSRAVFYRRYAKHWKAMLTMLLSIDGDHGDAILDRVKEIELHRDNFDKLQKVG